MVMVTSSGGAPAVAEQQQLSEQLCSRSKEH